MKDNEPYSPGPWKYVGMKGTVKEVKYTAVVLDANGTPIMYHCEPTQDDEITERMSYGNMRLFAAGAELLRIAENHCKTVESMADSYEKFYQWIKSKGQIEGDSESESEWAQADRVVDKDLRQLRKHGKDVEKFIQGLFDRG